MITSENFISAFHQVQEEQLSDLLKCWPRQPQFTEYIKTQMMPAIASILVCSTLTEYNRIDIVFKSLVSDKIVVAIEHENNFSGSHSEIIKLGTFDWPLGVLITYVSDNRRQDLINQFSELIINLRSENNAKNKGELLVIFGPYGMKPPQNLQWEFFRFKQNGFEKINS